jgi:hypothetical protein
MVGEIEAVDERDAIEIAAKEFKQPAKTDGSATAMALRTAAQPAYGP